MFMQLLFWGGNHDKLKNWVQSMPLHNLCLISNVFFFFKDWVFVDSKKVIFFPICQCLIFYFEKVIRFRPWKSGKSGAKIKNRATKDCKIQTKYWTDSKTFLWYLYKCYTKVRCHVLSIFYVGSSGWNHIAHCTKYSIA